MFFLLFKLIRKVVYACITFFFGYIFIQFATFQLNHLQHNIWYLVILLGVTTILGFRFFVHRKRKIPYFKRTIGYFSILFGIYIVYTWLLSSNLYPTVITTDVRLFQPDLIVKTINLPYTYYVEISNAIKTPSIILLVINIVLPFIRNWRKK